jgi:hypothetical protein
MELGRRRVWRGCGGEGKRGYGWWPGKGNQKEMKEFERGKYRGDEK